MADRSKPNTIPLPILIKTKGVGGISRVSRDANTTPLEVPLPQSGHLTHHRSNAATAQRRHAVPRPRRTPAAAVHGFTVREVERRREASGAGLVGARRSGQRILSIRGWIKSQKLAESIKVVGASFSSFSCRGRTSSTARCGLVAPSPEVRAHR